MPRNTVALGVRGPDSAAAGGSQVNPFQAGVDIMRIQQMANENRLFNLKLQSNSAIGDIVSQYPDIESGLQAVARSPWAAYAADYINTMRNAELASANIARTHAETGKLNLETGDTAQHVFVKNMIPYWDGVRRGLPEDQLEAMRGAAIQQTLATQSGMTPDQRANAVAGMQAWFTGINAGLPSDPAAANAERSRRIGLSLTTAGMGAPEIDATLGKTTIVDTPQGHYVVNATPFGIQPQGFIPSGIAPTLTDPGRAAYPGTGYQPVQAAPYMPTGVPSGPAQPNQLGGAGQPVPAPASTPAPASAPAPAPTPAPAPASNLVSGLPPNTTAGDGTPLWNESNIDQLSNTPGTMDATGSRFIWQDTNKQEIAKNQYNEWATGADHREYQGVMRAKMQLQTMDDTLDHIANTPFTTGQWADERLAIGRTVNTTVDLLRGAGLIDDATAKKFSFDPTQIASAEDFLKSQTIAQFATVVNNFGAQREAAQTIMRALQAVPGFQNTFMGNKLVLEGLRAAAQRVQDLRQFQERWTANPNNHGNLLNAETEFDKLHPPEQYSQKVMNDFGLGRNGFTSREAILNANAHNWITPEMAQEELRKFPRVTSP